MVSTPWVETAKGDQGVLSQQSVAQVTDRDAVDPTSEFVPTIGSRVGRFVILDLIGEGGMGRVFRAYDLKLNRHIALKLLRGGNEPCVHLRFRREAQAMARLNHPNILPIFDVGRHPDGAFIAMPLVEGQTVSVWLQTKPRTQREILDVFIAAGRGLQAAHDQGILHRDFKPSNVMVGQDGRVWVMDFGLACSTYDSDEMSTTKPRESHLDSSHLDSSHFGSSHLKRACLTTLFEQSMTQTGTVLGSPRYMAPEQHRGGHFGPLTDQYSFCVSLWEALYGVRPFHGTNLLELFVEKVDRRPFAPSDVRLPGWLHQTLLRGLSPYPPDRFESMAALLAELGRGSRSGSARWRLVCGMVTVLAVGVVGMETSCETVGPQCLPPQGKLTGIWDPKTREQVHTAFEGSGASYAEDTWRRVSSIVNDYCSNLDEIAAALPRPTDATLRADVDELRRQLARVEALDESGKYDDGLELANGVMDRAEAMGYDPLVAEAALHQGSLYISLGGYSEARVMLSYAYFEATRLGLDLIRARSAIRLVEIFGARQPQHQQALLWSKHAQAAVRRIGDASLQASLFHVIGNIHYRQGEYIQALELYQRVGSIMEELNGSLHPEVVGALNNIGGVYHSLGQYKQALKVYRDALSRAEQVLGKRHPRVAAILTNIGTTMFDQKRYGQALTFYRIALSIWDKTLDPQHPHIATAFYNIGKVYLDQGLGELALDSFQRALTIREQLFDPFHPDVAVTLLGMGDTLLRDGHACTALSYLERAWSIREQNDVPVAERGAARFILARALAAANRELPRAMTLAEGAREDYLVAEGDHRDKVAAIDAWIDDL